MAIKFKLVPKRNPQDMNAAPQFYAQVAVSGKDTTNTLAKEIAQNTTMGRADIIGVLTALSDAVANRLAMGRSVDLLDLCIISPKVASEGVDNEADFNAGSHMRKVGVNIRPKKNLIQAVENAGVEKE